MNVSSTTQAWGAQSQPRMAPPWLAKLEGDTSDEAKALKDAKERLEADLKSGTATAETLKADCAAFHEAMKAYGEKNRPEGAEGPKCPPPPPQGGQGLGPLMKALESDDGEEATTLKSILASGQTTEPGTLVNCRA